MKYIYVVSYSNSHDAYDGSPSFAFLSETKALKKREELMVDPKRTWRGVQWFVTMVPLDEKEG